MKRSLIATALAAATGAALADPISITAVLAPIIGGTAAAFVVSYAGTLALTALTVYGSARARSKQRKAMAAARAAYNAGLADRTLTLLESDPARRYVMGWTWTGGSVVAMFTSDKDSIYTDGRPYTKADSYKHVVIVWAHHQCQAISDLAFEGVNIGPLDGDGWAVSDHWASKALANQSINAAGGAARTEAIGAGATVIAATLVLNPGTADASQVPVGAGGAYGWSVSGSDILLPAEVLIGGAPYATTAADLWAVDVSKPAPGRSAVRVRHHLGEPGQAADALLMSLAPGEWTAAHIGTGICYSVITMDLERQEFQSGPGGWTAHVQGALVPDPRLGGGPYWTSNPALLANWWLQHPAGMGVAVADVDQASVIAAANACDELVDYPAWDGSAYVPTLSRRYTLHGAIRSDADREAVLQDMAECMGGWVYPAGQWVVQAGAWVPPVMDLTDDDLYGSISIVQSGEPMGELYNSVRGRYIASGTAVPQDMTPYSNAAFVAADGARLWHPIELPFTDSDHRATHLARMQTEQIRNGLTISYPAKMRAWPLRPGDRVRVQSAEYGFALKFFRVTDWSYGLAAPVGLTLQEDSPEAYDLVDATLPDPTPNTSLPSPVDVPELEGVALASGTAELLRQADGTITSRVHVSWDASPAPYMMGGRIELMWRAVGSVVWARVDAPGDATDAYLLGAEDGTVIIVSVTAVNGLGYRSPEVWRQHRVLGKLEPAANVSGLGAVSVGASAAINWDHSTEVDYKETELRVGASWADGTRIFVGAASGHTWAAPTLGTFIIWAKHRDRSGNESIAPASFEVDITGSTVKSLRLSATSNIIKIAAGGAADPASLTLTAVAANITTGAPVFTVTGGTATLVGSGLTRTLAAVDMVTDVVTVQVSWDGLTDVTSIVKVRDGVDGTAGGSGSFNWLLYGAAAVTGNSLRNSTPTGTASAAGASVESYLGGAQVSFKVGVFKDFMSMGLGTSSAGGSPDYGWTFFADGSAIPGPGGTITTATTAEAFSVAYDGANIKYSKSGTVVRTVAVGADITLYLAAQLNVALSQFDAITFAGAVGTSGPRTYRQESDPGAVPEGSTWTVPSTGKSYLRQSGAWIPNVGPGSVTTTEIQVQAVSTNGITINASTTSPGSGFGDTVTLAFFVGPTITLADGDLLDIAIDGTHSAKILPQLGTARVVDMFRTEIWMEIKRGAEPVIEIGPRVLVISPAIGPNLVTPIPIPFSVQATPGAGAWTVTCRYRCTSLTDQGLTANQNNGYDAAAQWRFKRIKR